MEVSGEPRPGRAGPLVAGYQGGWFHPATGYSLPAAARLAALVGELPAERVFGPELDALCRVDAAAGALLLPR